MDDWTRGRVFKLGVVNRSVQRVICTLFVQFVPQIGTGPKEIPLPSHFVSLCGEIRH